MEAGGAGRKVGDPLNSLGWQLEELKRPPNIKSRA